MDGFIAFLKRELKDLAFQIQGLEQRQDSYPRDGTLQINIREKKIQYYHKTLDSNTVGKYRLRYIKKDDIGLAQKLAQRDYEIQLLKKLSARYSVIKKACDVYDRASPSKAYYKLHTERKKLIIPRSADLSDEQFAAQWQDITYQGKAFTPGDPEIYSAKGERVRSKSEKIIADTFERQGIPYRYECPILLSTGRTIYPDFTVLNKETRKEYFLEHFGMMDNPEYAEKAVQKIIELQKCGIFPGDNLLMTFETRAHPFNSNALDGVISKFLL